MRSVGRSIIAALAVAPCLALIGLGSATAGGTASVTAVSASAASTLGLSGFHEIAADSSRGHLFISEGSTSVNSIVVTDLSGRQVATIAGQKGVMGITLSPDHSVLYAALAKGHAITAISTKTLRQVARYSTGNISPYDVAWQDRRLVVSYYHNTAPQTGITTYLGIINLAAARPAFKPKFASFDPNWLAAPLLSGDPLGSGEVLAVVPGGEGEQVAVEDLADNSLFQSDFFNGCENAQNIAMEPGGRQFLLACGSPYDIPRFNFGIYTGFSAAGSYRATYYPSAVAIASNGSVAATTSTPTGGELFVYRAGRTKAFVTDSFTGLVPAGLAWSADSTRVYAVSELSKGEYVVHVVNVSAIAASHLALGGTSSTTLGKTVTVTGRLTFGRSAVPAGTRIYIQRTLPSGSDLTLFTVHTRTGGRFSLTDKPRERGRFTYKAFFQGTASHSPATASRMVTVRG